MQESILGAWVASFLTLAIFSYLYNDNPFYKFAEHVYIGVSAAYWGSIAFWNQIVPNMFGRLWPQADPNTLTGFNVVWYKLYAVFHFFSDNIFPENGINANHQQNLFYILPFLLGIFMLLRLVPSIGWLSRWSLAYVVGLAAGLRMYGFMSSNVLSQIYGTILPLHGHAGDPFWTQVGTVMNNLVIIVGTLSALYYFFFSMEHKGIFRGISRVGIYFLMVSFGASFGFAVMGRISLLIGRFNSLIEFSSGKFGYASLVLLVLMVATLFILSRKDQEDGTES